MKNIEAQSDSSDVLLKLRNIVRDKTRFESDDVNQVSASDIMQNFVVSVHHKLEVMHDGELITGRFLLNDTSERQSSEAPGQDSVVEGESLLDIASRQIQSKVINTETKYNFASPGVFLKHHKKFYKLDDCTSCSGKGKKNCTTCSTSGKVSCTKCYGKRRISCDAYGCSYGKQNCSACGGLGNKQVQVSKQVWSYSTNSMVTEYVWVTEKCNACTYGKVTCSKCFGSSQINCGLCSATGMLTCNSCSGQGYISCVPCEGSGKTGQANWADVYNSSEYKLTLFENPCDESIEIQSKEGVHGVAPLASEFAFEELIATGHLNSQITANYKGCFKIYRLGARCNGKDYSIVAYGKDFKWLTLANLIEDLVVNDLKELQKVLLESISQGIFNNETDSLLTATKNVIASEVNTDLIDADFNSNNTEQINDMFSPEFASNVKSNIKGAIKLIFIRLARKFWWKLALSIPLIYLATWFFWGQHLEIIISLGVIVIGWIIFRHQTLKVLESNAIEKYHGKWMFDSAKRTGGDRMANTIVVLPALILLIGLIATLPQYSFLKKQERVRDSLTHGQTLDPAINQILVNKTTPEETSFEVDKNKHQLINTPPIQKVQNDQNTYVQRKSIARSKETSQANLNTNQHPLGDDQSINKEMEILPSEQVTTTQHTNSTNPSSEPAISTSKKSELSETVEKYTGLKIRSISQEELDQRKSNCPIPGQC